MLTTTCVYHRTSLSQRSRLAGATRTCRPGPRWLLFVGSTGSVRIGRRLSRSKLTSSFSRRQTTTATNQHSTDNGRFHKTTTTTTPCGQRTKRTTARKTPNERWTLNAVSWYGCKWYTALLQLSRAGPGRAGQAARGRSQWPCTDLSPLPTPSLRCRPPAGLRPPDRNPRRHIT